jgi:hypothetical protein
VGGLVDRLGQRGGVERREIGHRRLPLLEEGRVGRDPILVDDHDAGLDERREHRLPVGFYRVAECVRPVGGWHRPLAFGLVRRGIEGRLAKDVPWQVAPRNVVGERVVGEREGGDQPGGEPRRPGDD